MHDYLSQDLLTIGQQHGVDPHLYYPAVVYRILLNDLRQCGHKGSSIWR